MKGVEVCLSLGSNMGDRASNLIKALDVLSDKISGLISSSMYETEPWGFEAELSFYNMCIVGKTDLNPAALLDFCLEVEQKMGRKRKSEPGYVSRIIDIDIIYFENLLMEDEKLMIPHPLMQERNFVLFPLEELKPSWVHPKLNKGIKQLIDDCPDKFKALKVEDVT